jgi:hypothetical protein
VAPGKVHAFLKLLSKIGLPAVQMTPAGALEAYQTVADGDPDRLFIIQNLHKFAELDATISFRSEAPARKTVILNDAFAKYVRSSYVTVMRYRQELSAISK